MTVGTAAHTDPRCALPGGVPHLDDVAGYWVGEGELAHLPSLRNQQGQGHVNDDLSSLSWLAAPPYTFGYHTGVLRVDGKDIIAQRFRWKPWGVLREHHDRDLRIRTDTRMALSEDVLLWRIEAANTGSEPVTVELSQELFAMVAHTDVGWGWLYDVPWNHGDHHDFMALERVRATTRGDTDAYLLPPSARRLRLGKPRVPGIQRDEDPAAMLLDDALPAHISQDKPAPCVPGVHGVIRALRAGTPGVADHPGPVRLTPDTEASLPPLVLRDGMLISFEFRTETAGQSGVLLTHGNHPDSLQIGVHNGRPWVGITGERADAGVTLAPDRWHQLAVRIGTHQVSLLLDGAEVAVVGHWSHARRWVPTLEGDSVVITDTRSPARAAYAFDTPAYELRTSGAGALARWVLTLEPGETRSIGIACAYGADTGTVTAAARSVAARLPDAMADTEDGWNRLWQAMFTPGNREFSGHLPTLHTDDTELATSYYMGVLQVLYMRSTRIRPGEPIFLTGGPRLGPTTTFFWDHAEWSRIYALLEPAGLRSWLLRVLAGAYRDSFGIDAYGGGPLGNAYAANDYALFRLIEHYVCLTGDVTFLNERAGSTTVVDHVARLAMGWRDRRRAATGGVLADFGDDAWQLLECVPHYTGVVASFNAAYVAMTRSLAALYRYQGRAVEAAEAERGADTLAHAILNLYAGDGRWHLRQPGRTETIGHCLDFGLIAPALRDDLSLAQRTEMVTFVAEHLLAGDWMRALAADDPAAATADRPDHGAAGAFCAWPGVTAHGLAALGRDDLALGVLRRAHRAASGALWGQAMEILPGPSVPPRTRVAERGVSNRDSIAAAATADAVLSALFGIEPTYADLATAATNTATGSSTVGTLTNVRSRPGSPHLQ